MAHEHQSEVADKLAGCIAQGGVGKSSSPPQPPWIDPIVCIDLRREEDVAKLNVAEYVAVALLQKIPAAKRKKIAEVLEERPAHRSASLCSGSGMDVVADEAMFKYLAPQVECEPLFECEHKKDKRDWYGAIFNKLKTIHQYKEIADMSGQKAECDVCREPCLVPTGASGPCHVSAGTSCKMLSPLFNGREAAHDCIATG